jgi:ribosomal protein S18 acetylase RimI-like enzyme
MQLRTYDDPNAFLAAAAPLLGSDEARHNLGFGICATLIASPETYPVFHLWTVEDGGDVVGAALMTPPFNVWVARPRDPAALEFLAGELGKAGIEPPGVTAAVPEADQFGDAWERLRRVQRRLLHGQGIYKVESVRVPDGVRGEMRDATADDRRLLLDWFHAFVGEALAEESPRHNLERNVDRRLTGREGGLVIWEDGAPVSFAGFGGATPNGIRIGPVYTPPDLRRRGYGSALTAELSRRLIAEGRRYCFLYTDLANPTSNRIYRNIGYELVCESAEYVFE